jgi:hypothetical protein
MRMSQPVIEIAFTSTTTKIGTMEIVNPHYSVADIVDGVAAGTLVISYGGKDRWGSVRCHDSTEHVVAHIVDANDDAGGAVYGNLQVTDQTGASNAS